MGDRRMGHAAQGWGEILRKMTSIKLFASFGKLAGSKASINGSLLFISRYRLEPTSEQRAFQFRRAKILEELVFN
jgi:hypothetical protein